MSTVPALPMHEIRAEATWLQRNKMVVTPLLFLLPGLLFFSVYVIIPIFQSFNISLYRWDGLGEATYIGLANYQELLTDRNFEIFAVEQREMAGALPAGDPARPVHRAVPEPDGGGHPPLQVAVLLSLRPQPSCRRPCLQLVLPAARGLAEHDHHRPRFRERQYPRRSVAGDLRHHRGGALAADGLLHDPVSYGPERRGPRAGGGRTA